MGANLSYFDSIIVCAWLAVKGWVRVRGGGL